MSLFAKCVYAEHTHFSFHAMRPSHWRLICLLPPSITPPPPPSPPPLCNFPSRISLFLYPPLWLSLSLSLPASAHFCSRDAPLVRDFICGTGPEMKYAILGNFKNGFKNAKCNTTYYNEIKNSDWNKFKLNFSVKEGGKIFTGGR